MHLAFVVYSERGDLKALDLDRLAEILLFEGLEPVALPDPRPAEVYDVPEGWMRLLHRFMEAKRVMRDLFLRQK